MNIFLDVVYPIIGFGLITYGAWHIYHPAGWIVAGVYFLLLTTVNKRKVTR